MGTPERDNPAEGRLTARPTVINLWAGPGAGKSTTSAGLFNLMKHRGYRVELVTEIAKEFVYARHFSALGNQVLVTALQEHRQFILRDAVEWVITDSPVGLGTAYAEPEDVGMARALGAFLRRRYRNVDVLVRRMKGYQPYGRLQTEAEAVDMDRRIAAVYGNLTDSVRKMVVDGNVHAPERILKLATSPL